MFLAGRRARAGHETSLLVTRYTQRGGAQLRMRIFFSSMKGVVTKCSVFGSVVYILFGYSWRRFRSVIELKFYRENSNSSH